MSKTSRYMKNNELVSNTNTNNQHPVRNHAKGRLCSTISNSTKIKDEDISIDLQMGFLGD
jgi:hypothetical protein